MQKLNIANLNIDLSADEAFMVSRFKDFFSIDQEVTDIKVNLISRDCISMPNSLLLLDDDSIKWLRGYNNPEKFYVYRRKEESNDIRFLLEVNQTWNDASIYYLKSDLGREMGVTLTMGDILFRNSILYHQGIAIHASAIEWEGKGIIFSAPSETGKSTQANAWRTWMGANVLNGDRPIIRIKDNKTCVYGTPWSGSSTDFLNSHAPLSAIILLEQAPSNSIRSLTKKEAAIKLMPRSFLPYFDENLMKIATKNLENIIDKTPVYLLMCKPDREAVELVHQCIK